MIIIKVANATASHTGKALPYTNCEYSVSEECSNMGREIAHVKNHAKRIGYHADVTVKAGSRVAAFKV